MLAGASLRGAEAADRLRREIEERVGLIVEPIDFRPAVELRDRIAAAPELLDALAPALGVLLARSALHPVGGAGGLVLRTNLSTRPFYNERAVHVLLALAEWSSCC